MNLEIKDVGDKLEVLFEIVGQENFLEIARMYGGNNVYIPTFKSVVRNGRNREIVKRYNGVNANLLAKEYGMCVNQLKRIVMEFSTVE